MTVLNFVLGNYPIIIGVILGLIILLKSFAIAGGDEFITFERKWFGSAMANGRTVAIGNEVGVNARTLGPGIHFFIPFIYNITKHDFINIGPNQIGIVSAITGMPMPTGQFFAKTVDCNIFQDGEAFLKNKGEKGPQLAIIPPGQYQINPHLFKISIQNAIVIEENEVGLVESIAGKPCAVGRIFAEPVECDHFQDADAFLHNGGQKGPQITVLPPGNYRINTALFRVEKRPVTVIPNGQMGLISSMDGDRIPDGTSFDDRNFAREQLGPSVSAADMAQRVVREVASELSRGQSYGIDAVYDRIDPLLFASRFDEARVILRAIAQNNFPLSILLSALTVSHIWRDFVADAREELVRTAERVARDDGGEAKVREIDSFLR